MIEVSIRKALPAFALDVEFQAPSTGITALFGRSGSGKTSIIQAIAGAPPRSGPDRSRRPRVLRQLRGVDGPSVAPHHMRSRTAACFASVGEVNLAYGYRRAGGASELDAVIALLGMASCRSGGRTICRAAATADRPPCSRNRSCC
jgi:molybdate transport system ATP-binding protein